MKSVMAYLIGFRPTSVELAMQVARQLEDAALRGGHPEVRATGVEDDLEGLSRGAQAYFTIVLHKASEP